LARILYRAGPNSSFNWSPNNGIPGPSERRRSQRDAVVGPATRRPVRGCLGRALGADVSGGFVSTFGNTSGSRFGRNSGVPARRLMRDPDQAVLGGVCAGIAQYFDLAAFWMRVATVIAALCLPKLVLLSYVIAWVALDERRRR
jgi:phage shock protein PspC (stress-responsive transcriptional regulator)